jgi:hypothetical protein
LLGQFLYLINQAAPALCGLISSAILGFCNVAFNYSHPKNKST